MFDLIGSIGRLAIVTGFVATLVATIAYFLSLKSQDTVKVARIGFHTAATMVFIASAALLILILKHQFQFQYVWASSSRELPLGLLMSTFYAGQEGSFLLWTLMVSIVGILLMAYTQKHENEREVMGVFAAILMFLLILLVVKNPFALIEGGAIPPEGKGLNPLLQNFWMQIHPPILFLGFALMTPPFALGMGALLQKKYQDWVVSSLPWVVGGAMVLGLGLALGGYWAYETLGWGGWWGWDPVENSSLIPWLVSIALIHTMLTQKRTKGLVLTNFVLAILSFVTVLYSTFLTRSGVLGDASVHSFVDPGRFAFYLLVLFMFVFTDGGLALLFARFTRWGNRIWDRFSGLKLVGILYLIAIVPGIPVFAQVGGDITGVLDEAIAQGGVFMSVIFYPLLGMAHILNVLSYLWIPAIAFKLLFTGYIISGRLHSEKNFKSFELLSRETFLSIGALTIGALTLIVLLGTSLPIVPQAIIDIVNGLFGWINDIAGTSLALGNTVEPAFYDSMGLPLAMIMMILTGGALLLKWKNNDGKELLRRSVPALLAALILTVILYFAAGVRDFGMMLLALLASFSFFVNAQTGYRISRGNPKFIGAYIAHIGVAVLLLGIIGSGFYSRTLPIELPQGEAKDAFGYKLTYTGFEPFWNGERYHFNVRLDDENREIETVQTVMFVSDYGGQEQVMRNPGIAHFPEKDIYIEPQALYKPDPEGGEKFTFTKGQTYEFGGYRVTFSEFDMNNQMNSGSFTIGGRFNVERYGGESQELMPTRTSDADGVSTNPALVADGDLEIDILEMTPNKEDLALSQLEVRLRNPNVAVNPEDIRETLVVQATLKPFISLVWAGIIILIIGFGVARSRRSADAKKLVTPERRGIPRPDRIRVKSSVKETESVSVETERNQEADGRIHSSSS